MNHLKTLLLMVLLTAILLLVGELIGGTNGLVIGFAIALLMNFFAYWYSGKLAVKMTRSRPLKEEEAPQVYRAMREMVHRSNMPMPDLYLMPSDQPNAFAAGRNPGNAVVSVTNGLLRMLNYEELKGVLAHELAHIKNRDILINSIVTVMAGTLMFVSRMGMWGMMFGGGGRQGGGGGSPITLVVRLLALILAPIAALLIRMAVSRAREYEADATGASIAGNPQGLAGALTKMEANAGRRRPIQVNEAASHMFIMNPLSAKGMNALFSTHPPIGERVKRLQQLR